MKRIVQLLVAVAFMALSVSLSEAWQVNIRNSCSHDVDIEVMGEHLFWRQLDCRVKVKAGTTGVCQMPDVICPVRIGGSFSVADKTYRLNEIFCVASGVCCCWNVNVEAKFYGPGDCMLER